MLLRWLPCRIAQMLAANDYGDAVHHCVKEPPTMTKSLEVMQLTRGCSGEPYRAEKDDINQLGMLIQVCSDCELEHFL